jgi:hypothetical protein
MSNVAASLTTWALQHNADSFNGTALLPEVYVQKHHRNAVGSITSTLLAAPRLDEILFFWFLISLQAATRFFI